jgi:hypothetical protein
VSTFWRRWLAIGAIYGMLSGLSLVAGAFSKEVCAELARSLFWPHAEAAGAITNVARQAIAVSGALTAGLGAIAWFSRPGEASEPAADRRAGRALAAGIVLWFIVDSAASVAIGAAMNVVGNVSFLVAVLPPSIVLAGRRA